MEFRVESVAGGTKPVVFVRPLDEKAEFKLTEKSTLGGVAIKKTYSKLNSTNHDGSPRATLFAFQPVNGAELDKFKVGEKVSLA